MFSTNGLLGQTSIRAWNDFHEHAFPGLHISGKNDDFFGQVQSLSIGDLTLTRPQSAAAVVQRRLNNSLHDGGGQLVFHLMQSGQCNLGAVDKQDSQTRQSLIQDSFCGGYRGAVVDGGCGVGVL